MSPPRGMPCPVCGGGEAHQARCVAPQVEQVAAMLARVEAKVDFLLKALEAGSVGRWSGVGPRP